MKYVKVYVVSKGGLFEMEIHLDMSLHISTWIYLLCPWFVGSNVFYLCLYTTICYFALLRIMQNFKTNLYNYTIRRDKPELRQRTSFWIQLSLVKVKLKSKYSLTIILNHLVLSCPIVIIQLVSNIFQHNWIQNWDSKEEASRH